MTSLRLICTVVGWLMPMAWTSLIYTSTSASTCRTACQTASTGMHWPTDASAASCCSTLLMPGEYSCLTPPSLQDKVSTHTAVSLTYRVLTCYRPLISYGSVQWQVHVCYDTVYWLHIYCAVQLINTTVEDLSLTWSRLILQTYTTHICFLYVLSVNIIMSPCVLIQSLV